MKLKVIDLLDFELPYETIEVVRSNPEGYLDWANIINVKLMSRDNFIDKYRDCYIYSMKVYHSTKTVSVIFGSIEGEFQGMK